MCTRATAPTVAIIVTLLFFVSLSAATDLRPRHIPDKSPVTAIPDWFDRRHVEVKFMDDLDIGLDDQNTPYDRTTGTLQTDKAVGVIESIRDDGGVWVRMSVDEAKLEEMRQIAQYTTGREIADLNNYFILTVPTGIKTEDWINQLNALPEVELAQPLPLPVEAPLPGDFSPFQGYLDPTFDGIDAEYAWTIPGGTGSAVTICDFEYSWYLAHQDLPTSIVTWVPTLYQARDPFVNNNHGTAVLGELVSMANGWGTTGASYGVTMAVAPTFLKPVTPPGQDSAWYLGVAMTNAMSYLNAGDIMLIEQQYPGPRYNGNSDTGLIPVEWYESWYNIIVTAVGNGIHVVEAAGNGYQCLDDPIYNTGHAPFLLANHSGAIMVGAGGVPSAFGGTIGDRFRMPFSNYGARVDLQGWGEHVYTTGYGTYYSEGFDSTLYYTSTFAGTSSAAPNVASAVALVSSINETVNGSTNHISPARMLNILRLTGALQNGDGFNPPWYTIGNRPDLKGAIQISGIIDTLYKKQGYIDYCPAGMPDFSMHLDSTWKGFGRWTYDGPVALANCFWWLDSKFEPNPVDPRPFYPGGGSPAPNDNYNLVTSYGSWDDHDSANVKPLIEALASCLTTDDTVMFPGVFQYGTTPFDMETGINTWLTNAGLRNDYTDTVVSFPTFDYLKQQLLASQNIILLLGFMNQDQYNLCRTGGHWINMIGGDTLKQRIGISDPYRPFIQAPGTPSNSDASQVDGHVYQVGTLSSSQCPALAGALYLTDYHEEWIWTSFENINGGWAGGTAPTACYAVIEGAFVICPTEEPPLDTCEYYKSSYEDYAPYGMPDFDMKQDNWKSPFTGNQFWSWCGPAALANCMWWFDSKYESSPVDPRPFYPGPGNPSPNDHYPLVGSYAPANVWDDHDTNNVVPLITHMKGLCRTDVTTPGTLISDLKLGFDSSLVLAGLADDYTSTLIPGPTFQLIKDSVMASRDVILLLGFYEIPHPAGCGRIGGHYVTVAGVCTEDNDICISDPYFDANDQAHGATVHNDAAYISGPHGTKHHDRYHTEAYAHSCNTPATIRLTNYPNSWSQLMNFMNLNWYSPSVPPDPYASGSITVMVDYALVITNTSAGNCDCTPGDANNDGLFNLLDILYLIAYKYNTPPGDAPTPYAVCSGDATGDCVVNLLDILYLISYKYDTPPGPIPCSCENWVAGCGTLHK